MNIKIPGTSIEISFGGKPATKNSQLTSPVNQLYSEIAAVMEAANHPFSDIVMDIRSYIKDYENLPKEGKKSAEKLNNEIFSSHSVHDDALFALKVKFDEYTDRVIKKDAFLNYLNDFSKIVTNDINKHIELIKNTPDAVKAIISQYGKETSPELEAHVAKTTNEIKEYTNQLGSIFGKVEQTVNANGKSQAIA